MKSIPSSNPHLYWQERGSLHITPVSSLRRHISLLYDFELLTNCSEALSAEVVVAKRRKPDSNACIVKTGTVCASRPDMTVASGSNNSFLRRHNVEKLVRCPREQRVEHEGMVA